MKIEKIGAEESGVRGAEQRPLFFFHFCEFASEYSNKITIDGQKLSLR